MTERKPFEMPADTKREAETKTRTEYRLVYRNLTEEQAQKIMRLMSEHPEFLRDGELTVRRQVTTKRQTGEEAE